jgi:hypothetical protein
MIARNHSFSSLWPGEMPQFHASQRRPSADGLWASWSQPGQQQSLAHIAADNKQLYKAYLMKNSSARCSRSRASATPSANDRAEAINTQLAALTARAHNFHSVGAFIAMAELTCGGLCPDLPGR